MMIRLFSLVVLATLASEALTDRSFFKLCAHDYYNRDRPNECKLKNYEFSLKIPRIKDFINCVFMGYEWVPNERPYKVQSSKMISDLKGNGDVKKVVDRCEAKYGRKISAVDYFLCLYKDPQSKSALKDWLKAKDAEFFIKC